MHKFLTKLLAAIAVMLALAATPAAAQNITWVSGAGNDANLCTRAAPCRTWAGALGKTFAEGEIIALDPGDYGSVVIDKSITLSGGEGVGVFPGPALFGISINAGPGGRVVLRGLDIGGAGLASNGVMVVSAFDVLIADCRIHDFRVFGGNGVLIDSVTSSRVTIRNSTLHSNLVGVRVQATGSPVGTGHVKLVKSLVLENLQSGLVVDGAGNDIEIVKSQILGPQSLVQTNAGVVRSYGGNVIPGAAVPAETTATK